MSAKAWQRWFDVLPKPVAVMQIAYERRMAIARALKAGGSPADIAKHLGISLTRVKRIAMRHLWRDRIPPVNRYLYLEGELVAALPLTTAMRNTRKMARKYLASASPAHPISTSED